MPLLGMSFFQRSPLVWRHSFSLCMPSRQPLTTTTTSINSKTTKPKQRQNPPRPTLPDSEIETSYLKGSGPGGQKINKTASAVQLTHIPTGVVVKSQETRSQSQNRTIARRILAERVDQLRRGGDSWVAQRRDEESRRKRSADKKKKRKYRKRDEEQEQQSGDLEEAGPGEEEDVTRMDAMQVLSTTSIREAENR